MSMIKQPSVVLEFKTADKYEKLDEACNRVLDQIAVRNYDEELQRKGIVNAFILELVF